ncbi:hypothetical protein [Paenibacillus sp. SYP-B4298]|uniref:hypothetical protein n=1 Tax=Paenibacillus sp. SYP-B4298 TaxID=2996034 RepID=UPI0022DE6D21|nr:hypothetical protein [Paenibacillus sp. SYP-B4298]
MKLLKVASILALSFLLVVPSVSATQKVPYLNKDELKELHLAILEHVTEGNEEEIETLPLFQKYDQIFNKYPSLKSEYVNDLDANNEEQQEKTTFVNNSKIYHVYEDGSFSVITNTTNAPTAPPVNNQIQARTITQDTGEQWYTATIGQSFTNDARHDIWGVYKVGEMHLVTTYTINSTAANITNTSTAGTSSFFPGSFGSTSSAVVTNNARTVMSKGEYQFNTTCPVGWGNCGTTNYEINTIIDVKYAGGGTITFTARSVVYR